MRVTQSMLAQRSLQYMSQNYEKISQLQNQLSSGKKITRASQDPVVAMNGIRYRTQHIEVEQFQRNLGEAYNWLDSSDSALNQATQALQKVRELLVQASNDTYEEGQRSNIAKEVNQLMKHVESVANTKVNNKFIFNGTNTTEPPVTLHDDGATTSNNEEDVSIELMKGIEIPVNSRPSRVFSDTLFTDLLEVKSTLEDEGASGEEFTGLIQKMDDRINDIVNERAEIGARVNRLEMMESRLGEQQVMAERIMSENEDADMEKVIMDLMSQENVLRSSLGAGARIIQPTLLDFLR
ncbi:flagellar hook-associated protein FlgL [Alteribacillus iranensis]|uniref:Flagellar hook-associated protein 3 FlgL n=1 Tax=Alteribacillus iranensis TaxID=930128 RepID=A0A1I2EKI8_9BACI|nr:flagellar hook-associated protein FlgL [Alteribacillus iranensis]SFE92760.1 flagellar hook-associated protein 3 FlgL [Alteribacillus iranensis]